VLLRELTCKNKHVRDGQGTEQLPKRNTEVLLEHVEMELAIQRQAWISKWQEVSRIKRKAFVSWWQAEVEG